MRIKRLSRIRTMMCLLALHLIVPTMDAEAPRKITVNDVINRLAMSTPNAKTEKMNFSNKKLQYENVQKSLLPSFSFNLSPISFNHSIKLLQSHTNGDYNYVNDYSNTSNLGLTIKQKILLTGGFLTINSNLNYLYEFSDGRNSFSSNPYTIGYSQQLWGGRKTSRLENELQELQFKQVVNSYYSTLSDIQYEALSHFFSLFKAQLEMMLAQSTMNSNDTLLQLARLKLQNGSFTTYEFNQVEIQATNSIYIYENATYGYQSALLDFSTYFGTDEETKWILERPSLDMPLFMDSALVYTLVERNNPFSLNERIQRIEAESNLHSSRVGNLFNGNLNLSYGTNQYSSGLTTAYKNLQVRQAVSLSFSIPVFQWGTNRNKHQIAQNTYQVSLIELDKSRKEFYKNISDQINAYNHAIKLWKIAEKSYDLAVNQYRLAIQKFSLGNISLYELFTAQQDQFSSLQKYYNAVSNTWSHYFWLRKLTLYDFITGRDLSDEMYEVI